ncbi:MAG: AraC family transcriptional regulator ligand-binding domain-containing protein [Paraperlucidibaca sp.]
MMNKTLSDRGRFAVLCYEAIGRAGYDAKTFITSLGISAEQFQQSDFCYPHDRVAAFWAALEDFTGDPDIGLTIGRNLPSSRGSILSCLFLGAPNFGDALESSFKFNRLLSDAMAFSLHGQDDLSYVQIHLTGPAVTNCRHYSECLVLGLIDLYREGSGNHFTPARIDLACAAPDAMRGRSAAYACPINFDCAENRIYFDTSLLTLNCGYAEPGLLRLHENYARNALRKIEEQDFLVQVRNAIANLLQCGEVTLESSSRSLGLNTTELKYRLSTLGTHFIRERENCRRRLVKEMLRKTSESISQIAFMAGFSEPSTFYRAFKRWSHGETPADFRARHQQSAESQKLES